MHLAYINQCKCMIASIKIYLNTKMISNVDGCIIYIYIYITIILMQINHLN